MAKAFIVDRLSSRGVRVASGGFVGQGSVSPSHAVDVMDTYRLDIRDHRARLVNAGLVEKADLVLGMEFGHGRDLARLAPDHRSKIYTLPEFIDRGTEHPPNVGESLSSWLERLDSSRPTHPHIGSNRKWEVADPWQKSAKTYRNAAAEIDGMVDKLVDLLDGPLTVYEQEM
jgi:protein-tyrosine-phosphatase